MKSNWLKEFQNDELGTINQMLQLRDIELLNNAIAEIKGYCCKYCKNGGIFYNNDGSKECRQKDGSECVVESICQILKGRRFNGIE